MRLLLNFFILVSAACFGNPNEISNISLEHLMSNSSFCVKTIVENRVYLNSDCIIISENGVFLKLNDVGDIASIPTLYSDVRGSFLEIELGAIPYKTCPGCNQPYFIYCKNPDCPLKKKDKKKDK